MAYNEDVNINLNILAGAMGGITAIAGGMSALTSTFGQFGTTAVDTFGALDGLMVSAGALVGTFAVQAASAAGEFEQGMKIVQAVSGQTGSAITQLGEQANQLSVEYRTAIGDITEGLQTLGRAGLNSADAQLEVLESGLQTAKLEGRNLNSVLEELIQNTALLGGNLDSIDFGQQSEYVNSLMVGTSMSAPIDTHDISQTLQYVGGTAAAAGANLEDKEKLEDLMGTIAAFAQKGVTGSMAGTALRAFLTKPASQDKSVTEGLSSIGLSPDDLWEDGGEKMKDVSDQIELIHKQMERLNLSTMDQLEIWGKIVGPKMGQQMMKLDADKIDELKKDIQEASSAEELATSTLSTYNQKINEMGQLGDVVFRGIGSKFIMFLSPVVEIINKILQLMANPYINTAVFISIFSLISHGLQKAYGMVVSLIRQIREGVSGITSTIQSINGPMNQATTSATAFKNEIYQIIEATMAMNSNIANTGTLSGAMQAHLVGKAASGYLPGFENGKTLPGNVVGVSDQYRQYFSKPVTDQKYQSYRLKTGGFGGITQDTYDNLLKRDKRLFEEVNGKYILNRNANMISPDEYNKLSPQGKRLFEPTPEISKKLYDGLSNELQKRYGPSGSLYTKDIGGKYLPTDQYNSLDDASKKQYEAQNYRLQARYGTLEQMNKEIDNTTSKLRIFQGSTAEWKSLSDEERKAIQAQTKEFRTAKAEELKAMKVPAGRDALGNQLYGYTTMHNIPPKKTLAELMSIEGAQKGRGLDSAISKQMAADMSAAYKQSLGPVGKLQRSAFDKLGRYAGMVTSAASKMTSAFSQVRTGISNFTSNINRESISFRGAIGKFTQSVKNLSWDSVKASFASFTGQLGLGSSALQALSGKALSQMSAMSMIEGELMTVEGLISELASELGITDKQFVQLVMRSEELQAAFARLAQQKTGQSPEAVGNVMGNISKQGGGLSKAFGSLVGVLGGPVSAAFMGLTVVIQIVQQAFQDWQKRMQQATTELQEAQSKAKEAQEGIKESFKNENSELTEAQLELAVDAQYGSIYDTANGDQNINNLGAYEVEGDIENGIQGFSVVSEENKQAIHENTLALTEATEAYRQAEDKVVNEMTDDTFGMNGFSSILTDNLGQLNESLSRRQNKIPEWYDDINKKVADGFLSNNGPVLTGSQKDDKYAGSREFAAIFAADAYRFGTEEGLRQFFGSDYDVIIGLMNSMNSKIGTNDAGNALKTHAANFAPKNADGKGIDYKTQAEMQSQLKNNKPLYQRLGREMYMYEKGGRFNRTAYNDYLKLGQKQKQGKATQKELKELQKIKNIIQRIRSETGTKLSDANILAMGQLQQLQDMYTVAQQQVAPGIQATVDRVGFGNSLESSVLSEVGGSGGGAVGASSNSAAIAAMLGAMAQEAVGKKAHQEWLGTEEGQKSTDKSYEAFLAKANQDGSKARELYYQGMAEFSYRTQHPTETDDNKIREESQKRAQDVIGQNRKFHSSLQDGLNTLTKPALGIIAEQTKQAYEASGIGSAGSNNNASGGGSNSGGDGGGSGSGDSGKNTKNRVDLVLCNKKEIPKLNVNLFKKEPNFTVLNKNFKLRDIKINTKDTPKSILDAVKNGIIDTAKRMDPKIIQDEESVYDPMGATEGTDVPSGSNPTSSDQ